MNLIPSFPGAPDPHLICMHSPMMPTAVSALGSHPDMTISSSHTHHCSTGQVAAARGRGGGGADMTISSCHTNQHCSPAQPSPAQKGGGRALPAVPGCPLASAGAAARQLPLEQTGNAAAAAARQLPPHLQTDHGRRRDGEAAGSQHTSISHKPRYSWATPQGRTPCLPHASVPPCTAPTC